MGLARIAYHFLKHFCPTNTQFTSSMRLSEEIVYIINALAKNGGQLSLTALADSAGIENTAEALAECESDGLLRKNDRAEIELTDKGREMVGDVQRRLLSADQLNLGEESRVIFVSSRNYTRFQKLSSLGFAPGIPIKVQQKFPSFVIQCEETQIALETEIARDIFVWR